MFSLEKIRNFLMPRIDPRRSLRARLGFAITAIALIVSMLASLPIEHFANNQVQMQVGNSLAHLAYEVADKLDRGMFERYREIQILTTLDVIRDPSVSADQKRSLLEKLQETYPTYSWIGLTDTQGNVLVSTGRLLENQNVAERPWFVNSQENPFVGDVHEAKLLAQLLPSPDGEPLRFVDVAAPVIDLNGEPSGVLGAHLSWSWAREVRDSLLLPLRNRSQVEVSILNPAGEVLLGSSMLGEVLDSLPSVQAASDRQNSYSVETWADNESYLVGFARSDGYLNYPGLGWIVLVRQRTQDAFAPLHRLRKQILIQDVLLALALAIAAWLLSSRFTRPILAIAAAADQIRQQNINAHLPLVRGRDEVAQLSSSLKYLVRSLLSKEQLIQTNCEQLELELLERRRAETALRISEDRFRSAIVDAPLPIVIYAEDGEILQMNQAWIDSSGYTRAEVPTIKAWVTQVGCDRGSAMQLTDHHICNLEQRTSLGEHQIVTRSGAQRIWDFYVAPIGQLPNQQRLVMATAIDVTERKQAESEVRQLNTFLEQRVQQRTAELVAVNKELETFSYSVSHDLRAPLRTIDGFSSLLLERHDAQLNEKGRHYLARIQLGVQRMSELIDALLQLAKVTRSEMRRSQVNLSAIAVEIAEGLSESDPDRQVKWDIAADLTASGDPQLLRIVLENLFNNAWKFTSTTADAQIEFGCSGLEPDHPANSVYFVRDNGVGFDETYASKLFTAFQRLHSAEEFPGTGVGLATLQRIVTRHGGTVWASGSVGEGASFYFTLQG